MPGPFRALGAFWALCCCMIWLMPYGGSDDPPQGISPRYSVDIVMSWQAKQGTPGVSLKDPAVPEGTALYEPNAALLREPPDPSGKDTGANPPYSDLVAEPVPVPVAIPSVLTLRVLVRVCDRARAGSKTVGSDLVWRRRSHHRCLTPFPPHSGPTRGPGL